MAAWPFVNLKARTTVDWNGGGKEMDLIWLGEHSLDVSAWNQVFFSLPHWIRVFPKGQ